MAAGLGFKDFVTGEVLTAADVDGYLMQGIWVFADATARDAAVTSPQEGNSCYLKDTDVIQVYSGSSWVVKSGGSSPLTTKGDLYTYSTTDARLPVGANGTTLVADSSEATGLKWATPSSGAVVQVKSATTTTAATTTGSTMLDTGLTINITPTSASNKILVFITQQMGAESTAATPEPAVNLSLMRDATTIWNSGGQYGFYFFKNAAGTTELRIIVSATYLDSPATTSAITYKTQYARGAANVTAKVQASSAESTITVMEVTP